MRASLPAALLLLAACEPEPENIQAKAENRIRTLEERANALTAEAENGVDAAVAALDNEAEALLDQANEAAPAGNETANAQ